MVKFERQLAGLRTMERQSIRLSTMVNKVSTKIRRLELVLLRLTAEKERNTIRRMQAESNARIELHRTEKMRVRTQCEMGRGNAE
eukprot:1395119-Amorphochlora_amoeboformis.AAC.2